MEDLAHAAPAAPTPAFADRAVPRVLIEEMLELACRAPSGTNTQPWNVYVLQGPALARVVAAATQHVPVLERDAGAQARFRALDQLQPGIGLWPARGPASEPDFLSRMLSPGLEPADAALDYYFRFRNAPVGLLCTVSRSLGLGSVLDYGMFLQNLVEAANARGLQAHVQEGWRGMADFALQQIGAPEDMLLLCGVALGYAEAASDPGPAAEPGALRIVWHG